MTVAGGLGQFLVAVWLRLPEALRPGVLFVVALAVVLLLPSPPRALQTLERLLRSRWTVALVGLLSATAMWFAWTSLQHPPILQDEEAYLLQAHLFASGRWADPAPPIPIFFEQPHVLVVPRLAAKYPPGHALLLALGVAVHRPGLIPVLLLGLTGALLFVLARDWVRSDVGPWIAMLAWLGWIGLVGHDSWPRPSYMSEISTSVLWLAGWYALLQWRRRPQPSYLLMVAVIVGWGAITRPLTMLVYAVPVGAVVLALVVRRGLWRQLAAAVVVGTAVLAIIALWSWATTGRWSETPLALYTAQYLPWDVPGFGFRSTPPTRPLPPEIACFPNLFGTPRADYGLAALPRALAGRALAVVRDTLGQWRAGLLPFAVVGLIAVPVELGVALATGALLLLAYLSYAHDPNYTIYYMEAQASIVALAAFGVAWVAQLAGRRFGRRDPEETAVAAGRRVAGWCALVLFAAGVIPTTRTLRAIRRGREIGDLPHRMFRDSVSAIRPGRAIVFVHFGPGEGCGQNLIENAPPLATARTWIVHDRGSSDADLIRLAPDRVPFLFDTKSWQMRPYTTLQDVTPGPTRPLSSVPANRGLGPPASDR